APIGGGFKQGINLVLDSVQDLELLGAGRFILGRILGGFVLADQIGDGLERLFFRVHLLLVLQLALLLARRVVLYIPGGKGDPGVFADQPLDGQGGDTPRGSALEGGGGAERESAERGASRLPALYRLRAEAGGLPRRGAGHPALGGPV